MIGTEFFVQHDVDVGYPTAGIGHTAIWVYRGDVAPFDVELLEALCTFERKNTRGFSKLRLSINHCHSSHIFSRVYMTMCLLMLE